MLYITAPFKWAATVVWGKTFPVFIYLFIFILFTVDLKLLIYTKKSYRSLYNNNIELIDVTSVTEEEMESFPNQCEQAGKHNTHLSVLTLI